MGQEIEIYSSVWSTIRGSRPLYVIVIARSKCSRNFHSSYIIVDSRVIKVIANYGLKGYGTDQSQHLLLIYLYIVI